MKFTFSHSSYLEACSIHLPQYLWFGPWRSRAGRPIVTLEELVGEDQRALRPPREQAVPPADGG